MSILQVKGQSYAYRRFGGGSGLPLLCLQHFTGTLDNWDPAVTDPLASGREVILFDNVMSRLGSDFVAAGCAAQASEGWNCVPSRTIASRRERGAGASAARVR